MANYTNIDMMGWYIVIMSFVMTAPLKATLIALYNVVWALCGRIDLMRVIVFNLIKLFSHTFMLLNLTTSPESERHPSVWFHCRSHRFPNTLYLVKWFNMEKNILKYFQNNLFVCQRVIRDTTLLRSITFF